MTKGTLTRTIILILALINQFLAIKGMSPFIVDNTELSEFIAFIFTFVASITAWWKNNSFTKEAIQSDNYMKDLKSRRL